MVFYYTCAEDPRYVIYMGKDKFENEILLEHGFPEDLWFHVDKLSSAHVYLRIPMEEWRQLMVIAYPPHGIPNKSHGGIKTLTEADYRSVVPEQIIKEMCILVKGNSIEGSKANNVDVIWTPFINIKKELDMATGSVSYHRKEQCWFEKHVEKETPILKALEKTKQERQVDLRSEKEAREKSEIEYRKKLISKMKADEKQEEKALIQHKQEMSYDRLYDPEKLTSNDLGENYKGTVEECKAMEEDFM